VILGNLPRGAVVFGTLDTFERIPGDLRFKLSDSTHRRRITA
jgi:hypothetical protein